MKKHRIMQNNNEKKKERLAKDTSQNDRYARSILVFEPACLHQIVIVPMRRRFGCLHIMMSRAQLLATSGVIAAILVVF